MNRPFVLRYLLLTFAYYIYLVICHDYLDEQFILCKNCGHELARVSDLIYKKSPFALQTRNDTTVFQIYNHSHANNKHNSGKPLPPLVATVQLLRNPHGSEFELVTLSKADVHFLNETKSFEATWFPNFSWTIILCPHCLQHIGWYFESVESKLVAPFFAFILENIFNEKNADESIIIQPRFNTI